MSIPLLQNQLEEKQIENYCKNKISIKGNTFTLIESRPYWKDPSKWTDLEIAKIKFNTKENKWQLYYCLSNGKCFPYDSINLKKEITDLLQEIDEDPRCVFWG